MTSKVPSITDIPLWIRGIVTGVTVTGLLIGFLVVVIHEGAHVQEARDWSWEGRTRVCPPVTLKYDRNYPRSHRTRTSYAISYLSKEVRSDLIDPTGNARTTVTIRDGSKDDWCLGGDRVEFMEIRGPDDYLVGVCIDTILKATYGSQVSLSSEGVKNLGYDGAAVHGLLHVFMGPNHPVNGRGVFKEVASASVRGPKEAPFVVGEVVKEVFKQRIVPTCTPHLVPRVPPTLPPPPK